MSADIRTITIEDVGEITYDADMPIGSLRGLMDSSKDSDLGGMLDSLAEFVISWPYKGDPSKPEDWNKLRRSEFTAAAQAIVEDLGKLGEE